MKILSIKPFDDKIIVEVEGYSHAQPVFPADIKPEDLETALKAWKVNQDEVDAINAQALIDAANKVEPKVDSKLTDLIGKEI